MTLPTKPYATSAQVGILVPNLLNGGDDFDPLATFPKQSQVTQILTWISNQIDIQFGQAGYIMPFAEITGESWLDHQTQYLQMLTAMGSAAYVGQWLLNPAPALNPGRNTNTGNVYQNMFNLELKKIWDEANKSTTIRFRAQTYSGSPAEQSIREPIGPSLDYIEGRMNPENHLSFLGYTELKHNIQWYVENEFGYRNPFNWDNFFGLFEHKLNGYSYPQD